jgi:hypothetical protein
MSRVCDPLVKSAIDALGTLEAAAQALNVSKSYLYMIIKGDRQPGKKLLQDLGLSRVELITRAQ